MSRVPVPEASLASSSSSLSCCRPGWGCRSAHLGLGVLAQHAEQPPHLGQRRAGGVADRGQPLRAGRGHARRGQPGGLGLHGDHRDVVRHDVVQLAGDPRALPARRVLEQRARDDLLGGAVLRGLGCAPAGRPRPTRPPGRAAASSTARAPGRRARGTERAPAPGTAARGPRPAAVSRCGPAGTARPAARSGPPRSARGTRRATAGSPRRWSRPPLPDAPTAARAAAWSQQRDAARRHLRGRSPARRLWPGQRAARSPGQAASTSSSAPATAGACGAMAIRRSVSGRPPRQSPTQPIQTLSLAGSDRGVPLAEHPASPARGMRRAGVPRASDGEDGSAGVTTATARAP